MKKLSILLLFAILGCKEAIKNEVKTTSEKRDDISFATPEITQNSNVYAKADLLGYWVGSFNSGISDEEVEKIIEKDSLYASYNLYKKITFSIDKIKDNKIEGHAVVGGNLSTFEGEITQENNAFNIAVTEIGGKSTDGKFALSIAIRDSFLKGNWIANNIENVPIYKRKLELEKKFFFYNPENTLDSDFKDLEKNKKITVTYEDEDSLGNPVTENEIDYQYFSTTKAIYNLNPSKQLLKKEVVQDLTKADIYILRNSIFARHGYTFKDRKLREYFDQIDWYMPVYGDVKNDLTEIEKKNIDLLLRYEQNAKEYYDVFGR